MLENARFSPTQNSTLEAMFNFSTINKNLYHWNVSDYINVDVVKAFLNFLYGSTVDEQDYEK
jgi:hypothetical protein